MGLYAVESLDDPRLSPYRALKERELAREGGRFIAEGEHVVRRLLESDFPVESMLMSQRRVEELGAIGPGDVPVYVVSEETMRGVIGFKFHSGVLACGKRKRPPTVEEIAGDVSRGLMLVACPEISNTENLGSLIRISAAFGADAMILGERSADPFFRQAVRVSMGTVFRLPIVRSENIVRDLELLRGRWNVELAATVLAEDAEQLSAGVKRSSRFAILFGNEAQGLPTEIVGLCQRRLTIPMRLGTDSLNVAVAAGVFLYHFTREV
jgi:tRNA G18 (ribose-2'-O)-methylase SpoU